jgi:transposase-like protein
MAIDKKLIDQLLTDYKKPEDIIGENGLLKELTKAILERALAAEMTEHLGYEKHDPAGHHRGNTRTATSASWSWRRPAIANLRSIPRLWLRDRRAGRGSMTRLFPCTRGG